MNHCCYCNMDYKDRYHKGTATHFTNEYRTFLSQRVNNDDSSYKERETVISEYKDYLKDETYNCITCDFETTYVDNMLKHEETCMGLKVDTSIQIYDYLECGECGWRVKKDGQKMSPKYMMNRHNKTCLQKKRKRITKTLHNFIQDCSDDVLNNMFNNYIKQN